MSTISTLQASILRWINRPESEMGDIVKENIFQVLSFMQSKVKFACLLDEAELTFPANTLTITPTQNIRFLQTARLLSASGSDSGVELKMKSLELLFGDKLRYEHLHTYPDQMFAENELPAFDEYVKSNGPFLFRLNGKIGLYPTSDSERYVKIYYVGKIDSSFDVNTEHELLTEAEHFIVLKTVERLNDFLKIENRNTVTEKRVQEAWDAVMNWNETYNSFGVQ